MLLIEYPKCSTCRKAKKWLDEHQIAYTDRHIVEENPTMEELKAWQAASGLPVRKFFNTSGMLYKEMQSRYWWASRKQIGRTNFFSFLFSGGFPVRFRRYLCPGVFFPRRDGQCPGIYRIKFHNRSLGFSIRRRCVLIIYEQVTGAVF